MNLKEVLKSKIVANTASNFFWMNWKLKQTKKMCLQIKNDWLTNLIIDCLCIIATKKQKQKKISTKIFILKT